MKVTWCIYHPLIPLALHRCQGGGGASGSWRIHRRLPFWCAACWLSEPSGHERVSDWAHPSWCPALWAQIQQDSLGAGRRQHSSAKLEHVWLVPASSRVKNVNESLDGTHLVGHRIQLVAGVCSSCSPPKKPSILICMHRLLQTCQCHRKIIMIAILTLSGDRAAAVVMARQNLWKVNHGWQDLVCSIVMVVTCCDGKMCSYICVSAVL